MPHLANVLSFSHQEKVLHETSFSILTNRNVFYFDERHFKASLRDEKRFIGWPSARHVEGILLRAFDERPCVPSLTSYQIFRDLWLAGEQIRKRGRKLQYTVNQVSQEHKQHSS